MVAEHLPMVFPTLLDIDNHDLLEPETVLDENVKFDQSSNLSVGPILPEGRHIQPVIRVG